LDSAKANPKEPSMDARSFQTIAIITIASLSLMLVARAADPPKLNEKDLTFVKNAAKGGKMEVDLGKFAAEKAANDDVKKFGQHMVEDHSKANDQLQKLAEGKSIDLKDSNDQAQKEMQEEMDKLSKLSGPAFDKAYIDDMVEDHEKDVKEFEDAASSAMDPDVKFWASSTLPTLREHLKMAKETQEKLKKTAEK
jgi:putative membrane protein